MSLQSSSCIQPDDLKSNLRVMVPVILKLHLEKMNGAVSFGNEYKVGIRLLKHE